MSNGFWWLSLSMEMIVYGWLVLDMTNSAWLVAVIGFFRTAPFVVSGFVAGPMADRFGRRRVILWSQMANVATYTLIAILLWTAQIRFWHLIVGALMFGFSWSLEFSSRRALLPDLVGKNRTVDALLLDSFLAGSLRIVGPFLSGWIIEHAGTSTCFAFLAFMASGGVVLIHSLSDREIPRTNMSGQPSSLRMIAQGLQYVRHSQPIFAVVLITVVVNFLIIPYISLLPIFARDILGQDASGLGLLGTGTGIGSFIGLIVINQLRQRVGQGSIFVIGTFCECFALIAFASSTLFPFSWIMLLVAGIGHSCFAVLQSSIVLLAASDEMRGRAMGAVVLGIGADPLGKLQIGFLTENYGAPFAVVVHAGCAAVLIAVITSAFPQLRQPISDSH
ncbi:MFS transporter [Chloroflexi bacterium TSY]|nr:MFS transporter [Chloroflexi bacterium TSY]